MQTGKIVELFHSVQGEGKYVGLPQVFLRLSACNMQCVYCDTDFHKGEGMDTQAVLAGVQALLQEHPQTQDISITGGEPLLQDKFLSALLPRLKQLALRVLLETNGTMPESLENLLPWVDIVAMDIKLPSVSRTSPCWDEHRAFLELSKRKDTYVKLVLSSETSEEELQQAIALTARVDKHLCFILQPVTPLGGAQPPTLAQLRRWMDMAKERLQDVRIVPQMHKTWGVR